MQLLNNTHDGHAIYGGDDHSGLLLLPEDGLYKASYGITSIQEVLRHLPRAAKPRPIEEIRRLLGALS